MRKLAVPESLAWVIRVCRSKKVLGKYDMQPTGGKRKRWLPILRLKSLPMAQVSLL